MTSSPYNNQSNKAAKKSFDTFKRMFKKSKNKTIKELCYSLNNLRRVGQKASPMELFYDRGIYGDFLNQFSKDCEVKQTIENLVQKQFEIPSPKGRFNHDQFSEGDLVRIRNVANSGIWDISQELLGCSTCADNSAYQDKRDNRAIYLRNRTNIHQSSISQ